MTQKRRNLSLNINQHVLYLSNHYHRHCLYSVSKEFSMSSNICYEMLIMLFFGAYILMVFDE